MGPFGTAPPLLPGPGGRGNFEGSWGWVGGGGLSQEPSIFLDTGLLRGDQETCFLLSKPGSAILTCRTTDVLDQLILYYFGGGLGGTLCVVGC